MPKLKDLHIEHDTDWNYSREANPRRGYHDCIRTIVFVAGTPQKVQQDTIDAVMAPYKGRTGPVWHYEKQNANNSWELRQGYDSGD